MRDRYTLLFGTDWHPGFAWGWGRSHPNKMAWTLYIPPLNANTGISLRTCLN